MTGVKMNILVILTCTFYILFAEAMSNSWIVWMFSFAVLFFIYHLLWSCIIHPENVLVKKTDNKISNPFSNFCLFVVSAFVFYVKVSKMGNPRTRILNTFNVCKVSTCSVSAPVLLVF